MKKNRFIGLIIASTMSFISFSQGIYIDVNAGYGFPLSSDNIGMNSTSNSSPTGSTWTDESVCGSYGMGLNFGLNIGYMLNNNIGIGIHSDYLLGRNYKTVSTSTNSWGGSGSTSTGEDQYKARMTRITPSVIIKAGKEKINPYARLGLVLGFGTINWQYDYSSSSGNSSSYELHFNGGIAIGANAEVGLEFPIGEKLSFLGSVNVISMSYAPTKGEYKKYTQDGVDLLPTFQTNDKEFEFVKELSGSSSTPPDPNNPDQIMRMWFPFSSVGVNIGLRISL